MSDTLLNYFQKTRSPDIYPKARRRLINVNPGQPVVIIQKIDSLVPKVDMYICCSRIVFSFLFFVKYYIGLIIVEEIVEKIRMVFPRTLNSIWLGF